LLFVTVHTSSFRVNDQVVCEGEQGKLCCYQNVFLGKLPHTLRNLGFPCNSLVDTGLLKFIQRLTFLNPHSVICFISYFFGYYTLLNNLHHHLPSWIRSFDLFRHRRVAIFSWGVHDPFVLWVCSLGRVSGVCCYPFFQGGRYTFLYLVLTTCIPETSSSFLMISLLILSSLVYPLTLLRKQTSATSRQVMSRFVVTHVSLP